MLTNLLYTLTTACITLAFISGYSLGHVTSPRENAAAQLSVLADRLEHLAPTHKH